MEAEYGNLWLENIIERTKIVQLLALCNGPALQEEREALERAKRDFLNSTSLWHLTYGGLPEGKILHPTNSGNWTLIYTNKEEAYLGFLRCNNGVYTWCVMKSINVWQTLQLNEVLAYMNIVAPQLTQLCTLPKSG